jgi:hypothetical protein
MQQTRKTNNFNRNDNAVMTRIKVIIFFKSRMKKGYWMLNFMIEN